jgi:hypothetical protein
VLWVAGIVTILVIVFVVFLPRIPRPLAAVSRPVAQTPTRIPTAIAWQTYRDPTGFFTLQMPAGWTARRDTGTGSVGDRTGNAAQIDYFTALGAPPHGTTTITVYVDESPIQGAFLHHWECTTWSPLPLTSARVAEVLAASVGQQIVLFNTSAAPFQVSWTIPGDQGDVMMTTPPTSVPRATFQADQLLFEQMRASFTPTPATPLVC